MRLTVTVQEWNSMCGMSKEEVGVARGRVEVLH